MAQFHSIEIKVPVPDGDVRGANKVMASYGDELDALIAKLPEGSAHRNWISTERLAMAGPRKTQADKIKEAVEADRAARAAEAAKAADTPIVETAERSVPRRPHHAAAAQ